MYELLGAGRKDLGALREQGAATSPPEARGEDLRFGRGRGRCSSAGDFAYARLTSDEYDVS